MPENETNNRIEEFKTAIRQVYRIGKICGLTYSEMLSLFISLGQNDFFMSKLEEEK